MSIASGTLITPGMKTDWLAERRNGVGASEAAAAIGVSPYETPVGLWQRKVGLAPPVVENEAMTWGSLLEGPIIGEYERRTGATVGRRQEFRRHPILPFMSCTLDGVVEDGDGTVVEVKAVGAYARGYGDDEDSIPDQHLVQVQHQMAVSGLPRSVLVVLVGGQKLRVYPVERADHLCNMIEDRVALFWKCVETRTPPTWGRMGPSELAALHPECQGEAPADERLVEAVRIYEELKALEADHEAHLHRFKTEILAAFGGAQTIRLPDGRLVKRYLTEHPEATRTVTTKAYTTHSFRILKGDRR